jgi:hypothetical protein
MTANERQTPQLKKQQLKQLENPDHQHNTPSHVITNHATTDTHHALACWICAHVNFPFGTPPLCSKLKRRFLCGSKVGIIISIDL